MDKTIDIKVGDHRLKVKSCPFCGSTKLSFRYDVSYGHGESGFHHARIQCNNCSASKGNGFNYELPTIEDEINAYKEWNKRSV